MKPVRSGDESALGDPLKVARECKAGPMSVHHLKLRQRVEAPIEQDSTSTPTPSTWSRSHRPGSTFEADEPRADQPMEAGHAPRLQAEASRGAGAMADPYRDVGTAGRIRRYPGQRALLALEHAHVFETRRRRPQPWSTIASVTRSRSVRLARSRTGSSSAATSSESSTSVAAPSPNASRPTSVEVPLRGFEPRFPD